MTRILVKEPLSLNTVNAGLHNGERRKDVLATFESTTSLTIFPLHLSDLCNQMLLIVIAAESMTDEYNG